MAASHPALVLTDPPLSRAGSLLQWISVCLREIGRLAGRLREQARSYRRAKADRRTPTLLTTHQAER